MTIIYVPVLRTAVSYTVSFGRRWSLLEQMLLLDLVASRRTVAQLADDANVSPRMVVEALINLLRENWIEIRADDKGVFFAATAVGSRRASERELPTKLGRDTRFTSLCFDQITGAWLRSDDLNLVYLQDLPEDANILDPVYKSWEQNDGSFRDLLYLDADQSLEPDEPRLKTPSRPFARFEISLGSITGLPGYAPLRLRRMLLELAEENGENEASSPNGLGVYKDEVRDTFLQEDIVVGGEAHLALVRRVLGEAATTVVLHSCFVHPEVFQKLLPDFEAAAKRKVRVELLWGLNRDPESTEKPRPVKDAERVLDQLAPDLRRRVQMSSSSSGSHAKIIIHDAADGSWRSAVGSCNFLSTWYDSLDVTICSRSPRLATLLLGWLVSAQLPAAGSWSPTARRLNRLWSAAHSSAANRGESGEHSITLLVDEDHYACIRQARDEAERRILIGCDLFGIAAETSAVVPLSRAAARGTKVHMFYQRPSRFLASEGYAPAEDGLLERGIRLEKIEKLHAKVLLWDDDTLAASSFNWLSTTVDGTRARGAELGLLLKGSGIVQLLKGALVGSSMGSIIVGAIGEPQTDA
ncbi:hypothetical protein [Mesorhizobium amorphae]|uniref:Phosphatidylserine/phosphatidylglycerophosphate/ cardiolipin synthase-like protein n=1 Tax=Mesorhizobium amorphae CCNWGS0123 TaxID=1082933 RepID=G6Y2T5_9HYPH|nr:hypothetical protein [Mesorhizobium amorphae]ANT54479.1 phosphatidylserine synthase [Mesorhizobium amorphae CCNWGS0123]EHH13912.1 phosphatidylserine/phosphatidylglycerophosphate/cardiolipin synthase-like protein [Mesorhizobium amorphae CCNWGS0123]